MNDRFRYRAWDKRYKYYCYDVQDVYDSAPSGSSWCSGAFSSFLNDEYYDLEQCTGLKDKNGKLIFEGDILSTSNTNHKYDVWEKEDFGYAAVVWNKEKACFRGSNWTWERIGAESIYCLNFVEVVGNIHENPELLEGQ